MSAPVGVPGLRRCAAAREQRRLLEAEASDGALHDFTQLPVHLVPSPALVLQPDEFWSIVGLGPEKHSGIRV